MTRFRHLAVEATRIVTTVVMLTTCGIAILAPELMHAWSPKFHFLGEPVAFVLATIGILGAQEQGAIVAALCLNRVPFVLTTLIAGAANFILGLFFGRVFGAIGLAVATLLASGATNFWYAPAYAIRETRIKVAQLWVDYLRPVALTGLLTLIGGSALAATHTMMRWWVAAAIWALICFAVTVSQTYSSFRPRRKYRTAR